MSLKKTLTGIVVAGALALGVASCSGKDYSQYYYHGKIGEDQVEFNQTAGIANSYWRNNEKRIILNVTKADGKSIKYIDDHGEDLKLESVEITKNQLTTQYTANNEIGKTILIEAQKQFDNYLKQILETKEIYHQTWIKDKIKEGLDDLK